jgi:hypothetical protein
MSGGTLHQVRRVVAAVAVVVAVVGWVNWQQRETGDVPAAIPIGAPVDPAVPDARLLQDVLDIGAGRAAGEPNFSYVPREQPPDLLRMSPGGKGAQVADTYQFGTRKLSAIVVFTATPADACAGVCVRKDSPTQQAFRYVTVSFTGNVQGAPDPRDPATAAAREFWAGVTFVPVEQAAWFADLAARAARAAA